MFRGGYLEHLARGAVNWMFGPQPAPQAPAQAAVQGSRSHPADPNDLARLPRQPTSSVISNIRRHKNAPAHELFEARVGATIFLLTYLDRDTSRTYVESFYPHLNYDQVVRDTQFKHRPHIVDSDEFYHWLRAVGQNALTDPQYRFDGRVIVDNPDGDTVPRWHSVKAQQQRYTLASNAKQDARHLARGGIIERNYWNDGGKLRPGGLVQRQFCGYTLNVFRLREWVAAWQACTDELQQLHEAKAYEKVQAKLNELDEIIPLGRLTIDRPGDLGTLVPTVYLDNANSGGGSYADGPSINLLFAAYYRARARCHHEHGETNALFASFNNELKLRVASKSGTSFDGNGEMLFWMYPLAKIYGHAELELACLKEAAAAYQSQYNHWQSIFAAFTIAKLWQLGEHQLDGTVGGNPLSELFSRALKTISEALREFDAEEESSDDEADEMSGELMRALGAQDIRQFFAEVLKPAISEVAKRFKFNTVAKELDCQRQLTRTASCSSLLFKAQGRVVPAKEQAAVCHLVSSGVSMS